MSDHANGRAATILNVDADGANRFAVSQALQKAGFVVREAGTAAAALAGATGDTDLILLALQLPDATGPEVCRRLKADPATAPVPVMLLAGECHDSRCRVAGFEAGAEACLARPVSPEELVAQIRTLVRLRRAEWQSRERAEEVERLLEILPVGVGIAHDPAGRRITHNPYLSELLGVPAWENASLSAPEGKRTGSFAVCRGGQPLSPDQLPMQLACTGVDVRDFECDLVRDGRPPIKLVCFARPLRD